jgi:hypothetical protein
MNKIISIAAGLLLAMSATASAQTQPKEPTDGNRPPNAAAPQTPQTGAGSRPIGPPQAGAPDTGSTTSDKSKQNPLNPIDEHSKDGRAKQ